MRTAHRAPALALVMLCGCGLLLDADSAPTGQEPMDAAAGDARGDAPGDAVRIDAIPDSCPDGGCSACPEVEIPITSTTYVERSPHLVRVGSGFVIAWDGVLDGDEGAIMRSITLDGRPLWEDVLANPAADPFVAVNGGALVVSADGSDEARFSYRDPGTGAAIDEVTGAVGGSIVDDPYVVDGEDGFVAVWSDLLSGPRPTLVFQALDTTGSLLGTPRLVSDGRYSPDEPQVAQVGERLLAVWDDNERMVSTGRWATFRPGDSPTEGAVGVDADDPDVASNGSDFAVVYKEKNTGETITLQLFSAGGVPGTALALTGGDMFRDEPAVAWNGAVWGVAFEVGADFGGTEIGLVTVSADATGVIDRWMVSHGETNAIEAAVAWSGIGWGVVWEDARDGNVDIYYAHVCP